MKKNAKQKIYIRKLHAKLKFLEKILLKKQNY